MTDPSQKQKFWFLRLMQNHSGAAAIEFALLMPVFLLFMFGMLEIGLISWCNVVLSRSAQAAEKYMVDTKSAYKLPNGEELRKRVCFVIDSSGLTCANIKIALFPFDNPISKPITIPPLIEDGIAGFDGSSFVIAIGYDWQVSLLSTPLLIPAVNGIHQIKNISYIATAERPIE